MTLRPGTRLLWIVGGLFGWSLLSFIWPLSSWLIPVALFAIGVAAFREYRALSLGLENLTVRRVLPTPIGRARAFEVSLQIENRNEQAWSAELRDVFPAVASPQIWTMFVSLPSAGTISVSKSVCISVRGRHEFGPVWLRLAAQCDCLKRSATLASPRPCRFIRKAHARKRHWRKTRPTS